MNYKEYIQSDAWQKRRKKFIDNSNKMCGICNKKVPTNYEVVHHLHYDSIGKEKDEDMMLVHDVCHKKIHFKKDGSKIDVFTRKKMEAQINLLRGCYELGHINKIQKKKYKKEGIGKEFIVRNTVYNRYHSIANKSRYKEFFKIIISFCPYNMNKEKFLSEVLDMMKKDFVNN